MGELLVSKEGLGYLIMYGSQVFNINLVITSVVILAVVAYLMYLVISLIEKKIVQSKWWTVFYFCNDILIFTSNILKNLNYCLNPLVVASKPL